MSYKKTLHFCKNVVVNVKNYVIFIHHQNTMKFNISLIQELNFAIVTQRIISIKRKMRYYPVPSTIYIAEKPSSLDIMSGRYYDGAILQDVQYGLQDKNPLRSIFMFSRRWSVHQYYCRGAKPCASIRCKRAFPSQSRVAKCTTCTSPIQALVRCNVKFYYLVEIGADAPAQVLFSVGQHSHGAPMPNKIPIWHRIAIEDATHLQHLTARMVQNGIGLPFNLLPSCAAMVNRDVVQNLLQSFKRNKAAAIRSGPCGPRDLPGVVKRQLTLNKEALDEGKYL